MVFESLVINFFATKVSSCINRYHKLFFFCLSSSESEVNCSSTQTTNTDENGVQMGPSGKPKLIGDEYSVLKQKLREQSKKIKGMVTFRLREMGEIAQLKTDTESRVPLFLTDVQHLIMYSQVSL